MKYFLTFLISAFILVGCSTQGEFVSEFVKLNGVRYKVTDEKVNAEEEIGEVEVYKNSETDTSGDYSNTFKKGTKLYKVEGIEISEAIAVKSEDGKGYLKLVADK